MYIQHTRSCAEKCLTSVPSLRLSSCRWTAKRSPAWYSSDVIFLAPSNDESTWGLRQMMIINHPHNQKFDMAFFWSCRRKLLSPPSDNDWPSMPCWDLCIPFHSVLIGPLFIVVVCLSLENPLPLMIMCPPLSNIFWRCFHHHHHHHHHPHLTTFMLSSCLLTSKRALAAASASSFVHVRRRTFSPGMMTRMMTMKFITAMMRKPKNFCLTSFPRSSVVATMVWSEDCLRTTLENDSL